MLLRQVTACTVFELNRESGSEDLVKLTVFEGGGNEEDDNEEDDKASRGLEGLPQALLLLILDELPLPSLRYRTLLQLEYIRCYTIPPASQVSQGDLSASPHGVPYI